jgi:hypothetical protein
VSAWQIERSVRSRHEGNPADLATSIQAGSKVHEAARGFASQRSWNEPTNLVRIARWR